MKTDPDQCKKHYVAWCRMFLKFYLKGYRLSEAFQKQLDGFILQAREREEKFFDGSDRELVALTSRKDYRKGLGAALVSRFMDSAVAAGARNVRLLTNTLASWEFYEKRGFTKILASPFSFFSLPFPSSLLLCSSLFLLFSFSFFFLYNISIKTKYHRTFQISTHHNNLTSSSNKHSLQLSFPFITILSI